MAKASSLLPLIILFVVIGILAFIGYQIYLWSNELADRGSKHMEKKNMKFTKDGGLRVSVKDQGDEKLGDKTQNVLVNAWNNAELPNYKSRLGWNSTQGGRPSSGSRTSSSTSRPSNSRQSSSQATTTGSGAIPPSSPPEHRPGSKRTPSTPGAWS